MSSPPGSSDSNAGLPNATQLQYGGCSHGCPIPAGLAAKHPFNAMANLIVKRIAFHLDHLPTEKAALVKAIKDDCDNLLKFVSLCDVENLLKSLIMFGTDLVRSSTASDVQKILAYILAAAILHIRSKTGGSDEQSLPSLPVSEMMSLDLDCIRRFYDSQIPCSCLNEASSNNFVLAEIGRVRHARPYQCSHGCPITRTTTGQEAGSSSYPFNATAKLMVDRLVEDNETITTAGGQECMPLSEKWGFSTLRELDENQVENLLKSLIMIGTDAVRQPLVGKAQSWLFLHDLARFILVLEEDWMDDTTKQMETRVLFGRNKKELLNLDCMQDIVLFFDSRTPCSCLDQEKELHKERTGRCSKCHNESLDAKLLTCAACKASKYCCKECQVADWPKHKKWCKDVQEMEEIRKDKGHSDYLLNIPLSEDEQGCHNPSCKRLDRKLYACGKCKVVKYCCKDCQIAHWADHKSFCKYCRKLWEGMEEEKTTAKK